MAKLGTLGGADGGTPVADPGFPIGGAVDLVGGGVDSRGGYVLKILYVKMKELGPWGGGGRAPGAPP